MREYNPSNPRHALASALAHECGKPESEGRYRKQSFARLASIAAARLHDRVEDVARLRALADDAAELAAVRGVALAERLALPVLRSCGDCGWHGSMWVGERRTGGFCAKPASGRHGDRVDARRAPKVDLDAAPPPSCPLRQDAPGGQR